MKTLSLTFLCFLLCSLTSATSAGTITGVVKDVQTGEPLPGANVVIEGTALGAATNLEGEYRISRVPVGDYILVTSFIGYKEERLSVKVAMNGPTRQDVELKFEVFEAAEVVVTALLQGQAEAINKQLSSNTIVNVVSKDRIEELPDQNAAESLGRLSGISIQRDAGEGQKVAVRGLSPKFNAITVNGERIPSTDGEDRSVDLSMISPDILAGIEVFKALTPDKDADAVGGTINFVLKKARPDFEGSWRLQYGYNDHETDLGQYKGTINASNRFLNKKLGVIVTGSVQSANRSSDFLNADYEFAREQREGEERAVIRVDKLNLGDRFETRKRFGASLVLDYDLANGGLFFSSFLGRTERDELFRRKRYNVGDARTEYMLRQRAINTFLLTNSLSGQHHFSAFELEWRGSFSRTRQKTPFLKSYNFRELAAFNGTLITDRGPDLIPLGAKNDLSATWFKDSALESSDVIDRNVTARVDIKIPFSYGKNIAGYIKFGSKFRDKQRDRDDTRVDTGSFGINKVGKEISKNPDLFYRQFELDSDRRILMSNFIDPLFDAHPFLDGRFDFGPGLALNPLNRFMQELFDRFNVDPDIDLKDYDAGEQITAAYAMASLNVGQRLLFLPGFRYERTVNDYRSIFGNPSSNDEDEGSSVGSFADTTGGRSYHEVLPMVHLQIKPTSWFDLRLAATRTLSRPDFFNLVPWQKINRPNARIKQGNPNLKHTRAWNYDAYFSFYNRLGLFTVGIFYKTLKDIDYIRTTRIRGGPFDGFQLTEPVNGDASTVKGIEIELQTNFKFLPSPFDGIVLYANYSNISSETFFPFFEIGPRSPEPPFRPTIIDTIRAGRLPGQANELANISIGYEKAGFTGRISMLYQGKVLQTIGTRSELDGFTDAFVRWDVALKQTVWRNLNLYLNLNNVSNQADTEFLGIRRFSTNEEFFGWTGDLGLRYNF